MRKKKPDFRFEKRLYALVILMAIGAFIAAAAMTYHNRQPVRITFNPGGNLLSFYQTYAKARHDGTQFVIDGYCISACTMITALIPADRVCVTPYAKLAFHSASQDDDFSAEGTRLLWNIYPEKIRALLRKHQWDGDGETANHPALIYIEGDELLTIFRPCPV